jgi:glycosyltransferase involved in cell wall biosynthesis
MVGNDLNTPIVTVAIPNYNHAHYLGEAIESVLQQTFSNFELLISDNCSTDNSLEVIKKYNDPRITWWSNEMNIGVYPNWNLLYSKAKGKYFKLVQSDDWLDPDYLKETVNLMEMYNADVAFAGFAFRGSENRDFLPSSVGLLKTYQVLTKDDIVSYFDQPLGKFIHPTTNIIRRELIPEGYGGNSKNYLLDMVFWAKAITYGKVVVVDEILSFQRMHDLQDRNTRKDKSASIYETIEALNILKGLPGIKKKVRRFKNRASGEIFFQMVMGTIKLQTSPVNYMRSLIGSKCFFRGMIFSFQILFDKLFKPLNK